MAIKKSTKAILWSAFIFPGTGHMLLKRYIPFVVLAGIALSATLTIMHFVINQALLITDKVLKGEVEPDIFVIRTLIAEQQATNGSVIIDIASYALLAVWLISIIDCYRLAKADKRKMDI